MGDALSAWARQIVFLILFATVIEMLLPSGELRKYVKMLLSLVVVVALIEPLVDVIKGDDWLDRAIAVTAPAMPGSDPKSAVEAGQALAGAVAGHVQAVARAEAEEEVAALVMAIEGVAAATVDLAGPAPTVAVQASEADPRQTAARVRQLVGRVLGCDPEVVDVTINNGVTG